MRSKLFRHNFVAWVSFLGVVGAVERMSADRNRCGRRSNQRNHYGHKSISRSACGCVWHPGFVALLWCVG